MVEQGGLDDTFVQHHHLCVLFSFLLRLSSEDNGVASDPKQYMFKFKWQSPPVVNVIIIAAREEVRLKSGIQSTWGERSTWMDG